MSHVEGFDDGVGYGVYGHSYSGEGVVARSVSNVGLDGRSYSWVGVYGQSLFVSGVVGSSITGYGVYGASNSGRGVYGESRYGYGVKGYSETRVGVHGESSTGWGVIGKSYSSYGVWGESTHGDGVYGVSTHGDGVYGYSSTGYAAFLQGNVRITGNLQIDGDVDSGSLQKAGGSFKIDHPLDPANKYLSHSFVESPDMKNVYDGVVALDDKGEAQIELPDWFGALNKDFRYQLTAIGAPGPNLYIAEEISDGDITTNYSNSISSSNNNKNNNKSHFKIAGGTSGMKVSWQITGIRKDPWANTHRIKVEEDKPDKERGYYIYPDLYGKPTENGISRLLFPEEEKKKQELLINE